MGNKASCCRAAEAKAEDQLLQGEGAADVQVVTDAPAEGGPDVPTPETAKDQQAAEVTPAAEGAAGADVDVTSEPKGDPPAEGVAEAAAAAPPVDLNEPAVDPEAALDERDIALVQYTWSLAEPLGAEAVGKILFEKIFEIAPPALQLFPFKDAGHPSEQSLKHGAKVVSTVGVAVGLLGDLATLVPVLEKLGLQHVGYSVQPEHYDVVGQALLQTLGGALGEKFTSPVEGAWKKVYSIVAKTMIGKNYEVAAAPPVDINEPAVDTEAPLDARDVALVQYTWSLAEPLGAEAVGKLLFEKIFEIAPPALQLFPFKDAGHPSEQSLKHGAKVVTTVATAVGLLGDLPTLVPVLEKLGLQHVGYSVQPEHYDVVGQALLQTLGAALADKFTDPVKNAWTKVYGVMAKTMIGDHYKKVEEAKAAVGEGGDDKKKKEAAAKKKTVDDKKKKEAAAKKKIVDDKKAKEDAEKKKKEDAEQKKKDDEEAAKAIKAGLKAKEQAWKKLDKKEADEKTKKFHTAAKGGDCKGVKEMLEGDQVYIEAADKDGFTAMIHAGQAGKLDMIKMLIEFGGDPLAKVALGEWGNTAIHYACREGHRDVVKFLMKHKVAKKALTIKNHNGKVPSQMAKDSVSDLFD